jgi:hypothetical protein
MICSRWWPQEQVMPCASCESYTTAITLAQAVRDWSIIGAGRKKPGREPRPTKSVQVSYGV